MMDGTKVIVGSRGKVQCNFFFGESCVCVWMSLERDKVALLLLTSENHHFSLIVREENKILQKKFSRSLKSKQLRKTRTSTFGISQNIFMLIFHSTKEKTIFIPF